MYNMVGGVVLIKMSWSLSGAGGEWCSPTDFVAPESQAEAEEERSPNAS